MSPPTMPNHPETADPASIWLTPNTTIAIAAIPKKIPATICSFRSFNLRLLPPTPGRIADSTLAVLPDGSDPLMGTAAHECIAVVIRRVERRVQCVLLSSVPSTIHAADPFP